MSMSMRDCLEMQKEMGICSSCHDHTPCGCEPLTECLVCGQTSTDEEIDYNQGNCFNCGSALK